MNRMDEKEAEKRLRQIRKRLKQLKEIRYDYTGKLDKSHYGGIWKEELEQSIAFSAVVSGIVSMSVYMLLYRFYAPEWLKISVTMLLFITLTYVMHIQSRVKREMKEKRYLDIIDCLIDELEDEEDRILSEFPDADRWVPSAIPGKKERSTHRLNLLIELLLFVLSPTISKGVFLLFYMGVVGIAFAFTITKRSRELRRWEKECEEKGKLVGMHG